MQRYDKKHYFLSGCSVSKSCKKYSEVQDINLKAESGSISGMTKCKLEQLQLIELAYTVVFKFIQPPCVFPMISIVNKSCDIECCVNNMF